MNILQSAAESRIWHSNLRVAAIQHHGGYHLSGALAVWRKWSFTAIRRWEERLTALVVLSPIKESPPARKRKSLTTRELHAAGIAFAAVKARRGIRIRAVLDSFKLRASYGRKLDRVRAVAELKCESRGAKHWLHNQYHFLLRMRENCHRQAEAQRRIRTGMSCRRHRALAQAFMLWRRALQRVKRSTASYQTMEGRTLRLGWAHFASKCSEDGSPRTGKPRLR